VSYYICFFLAERQIEENKMQKLGIKAKNQEAEETWADRVDAMRKDDDSAVRSSTAPQEDTADGDVAQVS
jgi:hypothetical protein